MGVGMKVCEVAVRAEFAKAGSNVEEGGGDAANESFEVAEVGLDEGEEREAGEAADAHEDDEEEGARFGGVFDVAAVDLGGEELVGAVGFDDFLFGEFEDEDEPSDFESSCGGSCAASDEHEEEEGAFAEERPLHVVFGAISGGGGDGDDGEEAVAKRAEKAQVGGVLVWGACDREGEGGEEETNREDEEEAAAFLVLAEAFPTFAKEGVVEDEAEAAEDHEGAEPEFDAEALVVADAGVVGAEASGGDGGEGVAEGFPEGDGTFEAPADEPEAKGTEEGEGDVDVPEFEGEVSDAAVAAFAGAEGAFVLHEAAAANAEVGEEGDEEDENS